MVCVQAYLMGVVWSCYKYLTQANESRARHRSLEMDAARSPEDAEVQPALRTYPVVLYSWMCSVVLVVSNHFQLIFSTNPFLHSFTFLPTRLTQWTPAVFSERELKFMFAICHRRSVCCLLYTSPSPRD